VASYWGNNPPDLFQADLCGKISPRTIAGKNYFLLIVDDHNRFMWVEFFATKDEVFKCFK
jgi:hypothetical protein